MNNDNKRQANLCVLIVSYNVEKLLRKCLRSVRESLGKLSYELVVIDNASNDRSAAIVNEECPAGLIVENEENCGFGKAVNMAARMVHADNYLILNPDTEITNDIIYKMLDHVKEHPDTGIVGCRMVSSDGALQPHTNSLPGLFVVLSNVLQAKRLLTFKHGRRIIKILEFIPSLKSYLNQSRELRSWINVDSVPGSCFLVKGDLFRKIDGFDESFFLYYEDSDLFYRIKYEEKYSIHLLSNIGIVHHGEKSLISVGGKVHPFRYWSMLYYFKKHNGKFKYAILRAILFFVASFRIFLAFVGNIEDEGYVNDYMKVVKMTVFGLNSCNHSKPN